MQRLKKISSKILLILALILGFTLLPFFQSSNVLAADSSYQVSNTSDDVNQDGNNYTQDLSTLWIGNGQSLQNSFTGLRFNGINIPQGSTITSAKLSFYSAFGQWINVDLSISGDKTVNSPTFSLLNKPSDRTLTAASVSHSDNVAWDANTWYSLEDISPVIQEIINQPNWQSGNSLSVILHGTGRKWGRKFVTDYSGNPTNAPKLTISYNTNSPTPTPTPAPNPNTIIPINTPDGINAGMDALNYSAGRVLTVDKYGKYIVLTQNLTSDHHWAWSNNNGSTWNQGTETTSFVTRGSVAYNSIDDKLNVIWEANSPSDGIIYRRYAITRDANNNITDITREDAANINTQLDYGSSGSIIGPSAYWFNDGSAHGSLIVSWSRTDNNLAEVRSSMLNLTGTSTDGNPASWVAPNGSGDTFSVDPPHVIANKIFSDTSGQVYSTLTVRGGNGTRKNDLYIFVAANTPTTNSILAYRGIYNSTIQNWDGGWQTPILVGQLDSSSGYAQKYTLLTKPVLDTTNDRLYIGWPRWKDNTNGDTNSFAYLDPADTPSTTFDVYSALGTHSYAPTMDISFDDQQHLLYVSYVESTTNGSNGSIEYVSYDGTNISPPIQFYTSPGGTNGADGGADIPILYDHRVNNQILMIFRVNGSIPGTVSDPNTIDFGTIAL